MRNLIKIIIISCLLTWITSEANASVSFGNAFSFEIKSKTNRDTSDVDWYTKKAMTFSVKPVRIKLLKAYIDTAEMICKRSNIEIPSLLHLARAEYFFFSSDYNNASQEAIIAMNLSKNGGETIVLAKTLNFLGQYSLRTGLFNESIDYFNKSIELAEKNRLKGIIPLNFDGIANVYDAIGNQQEYRRTLQKMIDAALEENDTTQIETGYFRLGTSLTSKERNFNRADSLLRRCLEISSKIKDTAFIALSYSNLGWNQYLEKNYDIALKYYNLSLSYTVPAKIYAYAANSFGNIGTIYRDIGDIEKALKNYLKSIDVAKTGNDIYDLSWVYADMSDMYLRKKDTANAYLSYVLFKRYSDSLLKTSNTQGLMDARIRYEADSHNKELQLLSLRIKNQRLLIYGYTGLIVLSLAIGLLFLSRAKINSKRRISEMNRKISEVTQANLRQQMNPHFIFNTLNSIQYYMYQHDKLATNNYLTKFSSLMRKVLENSQHTSVPLQDELDALNLYLELEKIRFKDKFEYVINIDDEIDTLMYKIPTMLIQPYVENSICHGLIPGEIKGLVKIDLKLKKDYISCTIEDNGIGREAAQEKKNKSEKNHNSLGTQIVNSRLDLVNTLYGTSLKTIYSDLKNDKGEAIGTRVEIHIPIMT